MALYTPGNPSGSSSSSSSSGSLMSRMGPPPARSYWTQNHGYQANIWDPMDWSRTGDYLGFGTLGSEHAALWYAQVILPALVGIGGPFELPPAYVFRYLPAWWEFRACLAIQHWRSEQARAQAQANEYFARVKSVAAITFFSQPPICAPIPQAAPLPTLPTSSLPPTSSLFAAPPPAPAQTSAPAVSTLARPLLPPTAPGSPQRQWSAPTLSSSAPSAPAPAPAAAPVRAPPKTSLFNLADMVNVAPPLGLRPTQTTVSNFKRTRS